jgi:hypothetical protein
MINAPSGYKMEKLIEALQIFLKYQNLKWPTHCEHDILCIVGVTYNEVSEEDRARLEELHFHFSEEGCGEPGWVSYRFGSA